MSAEAVVGNQAEDGPPAGRARSWTLALACVAMFMLMLDVTVVNVALQDLRTSLGADFSDLQWVIDSYTLTLAAFLLTGGSLADRLGRKRVFNAGLVLFTLSSLAAGLAQDVLALNIARGVQGIGAAVLFSVGPALIGNEFRGNDRGKAFGVFGGIAGLALAFGPLVGGFLTDALSWRWIFLVNVPIGIVALIVGALRLRESRDPVPHSIDWLGMVTFGLGLTLLVFGFLRGESSGWTSAAILGVVRRRSRSARGVRRRREGARRAGHVRPSPLADAHLHRCLPGHAAVQRDQPRRGLPADLLRAERSGLSPWDTGLRFMPMMITLFIVAAVTGGLLAKVAPGVLIGLSIGFIAVGMGLMVLVEPGSSWTAMLPSMIVTGIGMGLFNPPRAAVTIGVVRPEKAGMASGMGETFQQVGVAVGVAAFGALFHHKVVDTFAASGTGTKLGGQAEEVGRQVATGGTSALADAVPSALLGQATAAARSAFVGSLADVMVVCAVVAAVGAAIAFFCIRRRDLHESAQSTTVAPTSEAVTA